MEAGQFFCLFAYYLLEAVLIALLLRAISSWFPVSEENRLISFLYAITEPFVLPFRLLFYRMNWFQETPIDVSFLFSYLVIMLLSWLFRMLA